MHISTHKHAPHIHELAARLQKEVDAILESVTDKALHAEFRESEIVEVQHGVQHDMVRESIDARIEVNMQRKHDHTPSLNRGKKNRTQKLLNIFFKRFEM